MKDEGGRMKRNPKLGTMKDAWCLRHSRGRRTHFILHPSSFILLLVLLALTFNFSSVAQSDKRSGAHSSIPRDNFSAADRNIVEKAIGSACAERIRDPLGSSPIDEMQARPSLSANNADAV